MESKFVYIYRVRARSAILKKFALHLILVPSYRLRQERLPAIRRAFDLDFSCVVLKDACFDADQEVHRVLTEKIFPAQATVLTVDAFIAEQGE
jgi:hypothetical protein